MTLQHPNIGSQMQFLECQMFAVRRRYRPLDHFCVLKHGSGLPLKTDVQKGPFSSGVIGPSPQTLAVSSKIQPCEAGPGFDGDRASGTVFERVEVEARVFR